MTDPAQSPFAEKRSLAFYVRRVLRWCLAIFGLFVLLAIYGGPSPFYLVEATYLVVAGWIHFLARVGSDLTWNPAMIGSSLFSLVAALVGLHLILRHFRQDWTMRGTLACTALVCVLFAAAISVTGIFHQTVWLAKGPLVTDAYRSGARRATNISSARQLVHGLRYYQEEFGELPASLYDLYPDVIDFDPSDPKRGRFWFVEDRNRTAHEWLYFPQGSKQSLNADWHATVGEERRLLLASPIRISGKFVVAFFGGRVMEIEQEAFFELLAAQHRVWLGEDNLPDQDGSQ